MSEFFTSVPVDIEAIKKLLPPGSEIEGVTVFNPETKTVIIKWHNRDLITPYSVPTEVSVTQLSTKKFPDCVKLREKVTITEKVDKPHPNKVKIKKSHK